MPNIFPDTNKGGVITSSGGVATGAMGVTNYFMPAATFTVTCPVTAFPDNSCNFQMSGAQMNAVVTELAAFAQALNPNGVWNCNTTGNLAANFNSFLVNNPLLAGLLDGGSP